jgi:hypothetical protein
MQSRSLKHAIALAESGTGSIAKLVAGAIEVGVIVPSILAKRLEDAGYSVTYHVGPGENTEEGDSPNGAWVLIRVPGKKGPEIVARAFSHDKPDAILQAVYAWLKEEANTSSPALVTV